MLKQIFVTVTLLFILSGMASAQLPDLVVSSGSFNPVSVDRGGYLTISANVKNLGLANSPNSHLLFCLSSSSDFSSVIQMSCVSVEPLAAASTSETKIVTIPVPLTLNAGVYFVGWEVDPYNEVYESDERNTFYLPNTQLIVTSSLSYRKHIPYPIIFIHGLTSSDQKWNSLIGKLSDFGWSFGGRMDFCLNYDGSLFRANLTDDIHDFTMQTNLQVGDFYTINFDIDINGNLYNNTVESDQAAIVKQGKALQLAIKHVLDKTGSGKVILVGHSMGGLAAREYLQNSSDWQIDGYHHVAKLLTIGTPHGGSNMWTFGGILGQDGYSDAVRDLRWQYSNGAAGVYLFGGNENNLSSIGFHNLDVNCNGFVGDNIIGLNQKNLPIDLPYVCIIGIGGLTGDGVVDAQRADLNNYYNIQADTLLVNDIHTNLTDHIDTDIKGLDEPTLLKYAYRLGADTIYYGLISPQSKANYYQDDYDSYYIDLTSASWLNVQVLNIPVSNLRVAVFNQSSSPLVVKDSKGLSNIDTTALFPKGKYYIVVEAAADVNSWKFPYALKLHLTPVTDVNLQNLGSPNTFQLDQNYPNPFNPTTTIKYSIPQQAFVSISVYDLLGREVAVLVKEEKSAGNYSVKFDANNLSSGVYLYKMQAGSFMETKKLILLK